MNYDKILVLDFGSQYNQLIARRIREFGVYSELRSHQLTAEQIRAIPDVKGIVFSGGPKSVCEADAFGCDPKIFDLGLPILGICYGMQLTCLHYGGKIEKSSTKEYGKMPITMLTRGSSTVRRLLVATKMDEVTAIMFLPFRKRLNWRPSAPNRRQLFTIKARHLFGNSDPEVRHEHVRQMIFGEFCVQSVSAENWTMGSYIDLQIAKIREQVGDRKVLCGLSGGVDSTVVAVLIHKAIGQQLTCMFIDHGLLRKDEGNQVMTMCQNLFGINVVRIDAQKRFLDKLAGVIDPEQKRKLIGNEFVYCFDEESKKLGEFDFLAQGTIYADVIESGTQTAQTIKSHHNVGGLPKDMKFKLVEPLKVLFKDEVRALGEALGIPSHIVWRQPFPGPGLGIRIIGDITEEKLHIVRESDAILREEIAKAGLDREIWQYFTVLTNIKSVGVMGDGRTYDYAVGIRAVTSIDGMTADWARVPYEVLDIISRRIVNEVKGVNRIVYDITSKPPATIEWE